MGDPVTGQGISQQTYEARRTSFGAGAREYDRVRPGWPRDTLSWLLGEPVRPMDVLDLGAGTGKGTRTLVDAGHRVTAAEPSEGMREVLRDGLEAAGVTVVDARAESLPVEDASFDAVVCLQAWHWVDPQVAGPEVARVLRPHGTFGLAWHGLDLATPWLRELHEIVRRPEASSSAEEDDEPLAIPGFAVASPHRRTYVMRLRPADLVTQVASWSHVAIHPERDQILDEVGRLAERSAADDGLVRLPHVTTCFRTRVAA